MRPARCPRPRPPRPPLQGALQDSALHANHVRRCRLACVRHSSFPRIAVGGPSQGARPALDPPPQPPAAAHPNAAATEQALRPVPHPAPPARSDGPLPQRRRPATTCLHRLRIRAPDRAPSRRGRRGPCRASLCAAVAGARADPSLLPQANWRFWSCSVILVYDAAWRTAADLRPRLHLVDFAHTCMVDPSLGPDAGTLLGLNSLAQLLA